ncbi:hypothetical protein Vretimale_1090 [Volvox reticuliferus]|uniref:Uncharacterized protein n=1 Tax=Volvox reticuliferus TaxID=1737510 RepID=A0A8J4G375_9CHLO|nr:hypothetical protein Vretimale_1090 [Volvox reticuliferus]
MDRGNSSQGALKIQQEFIGKLQRNLRLELAKLQAEETILKLMIKRERKRLARWARRRGTEPTERRQQQQQELLQQQEEQEQQEGPLEEGHLHDKHQAPQQEIASPS